MSDLIPASLFPILKVLGDKASRRVLSHMMEIGPELFNEIGVQMYKHHQIHPKQFKHIMRDLHTAGFIDKQYDTIKSYKWITTQRGKDILSYLRDLVKYT